MSANSIQSITVVALLLLSHLLVGQSNDPWAIKKQRKDTDSSTVVPTNLHFNLMGTHNARRASADTLPVTAKGPADEPPREITGVLPTAPGAANGRRSTDALGAAQYYMEEVRNLMQIETPAQEFALQRQWSDTQGAQHLRMQQQYRGVDVYGSELIVHTDAAQVVQGLNGRYIASPLDVNTVPSVSERAAIQTSLDYFKRQGTLEPLTAFQQQLLDYTAPTATLVILPTWETATPTLAWRVVVRPNSLDHWEMFVDAHTGTLISQTNMTCTFVPEFYTEGLANTHHHAHHASPSVAAPLEIMSAGKGSGTDVNGVNRTLDVWTFPQGSGLADASKDMFRSNASTPLNELEGVLYTYDAERVPNAESFTIVNEAGTVFSDPAAVSAHYNASITYDYFKNIHGRSSYDGKGSNLISIINIVEGDGSEVDNAFWNGAYMAYGNGKDLFRKSVAGSLDVGGHEMAHGVIGTTAGLIYRYQSGAINEHIADVFGVLIEGEDYLLAEDIANTQVFPSGAMRDMENPHNGGGGLGDAGWQPDHTDDIYTGEQDNGGVHINSGIPNRAFFLMATELGQDKMGAIYYDALTKYLTASSEFIDLRRAIIRSANDLYGEGDAQIVGNAFDAVGITDGNAPPPDQDPDPQPDPGDELPTAGGDDWLLTVNTDPDDTDANGNEHSLYLVNDSEDQFEAISITPVGRKPTVVDDGSVAFFITDEDEIQGIELAPPYQETIISDTSLWANLSVSKDGNRLAVITNQRTPVILILDLTRENDNLRAFELYNPTSQDGVVTRDVQFADAIEWDYSGEYLIYDAFNRVNTVGAAENEQDAIEYWDVNLIKVWDNTADGFGDGKITRIFQNQPKNTSIGNPTFSKTNRNIVAFDLFDEENGTYSVIATDLETGKTGTIYENNTIGFPSYSNDDSYLVFDALDDNDRPIVLQIPLKESKLEASGEPSLLYTEAQWTTWFSKGGREINSSKNELLRFEIVQGTSTIPGTIQEQTISLDAPAGMDVTNLVASFEQSEGATVYIGKSRQYSGINSNDFSREVTYLVIAENGDQQNYTVRVTQDGNPPQPNDPNDPNPNDPNPNDPNPGDPDPNNPPDNPDKDGKVVSTEEEVATTPLVYPNPFDQELYLRESLIGQDVTLTLYNSLGQAIPLQQEGAHFHLEDAVRPGLYILKVQRGSDTQTVRLVKR